MKFTPIFFDRPQASIAEKQVSFITGETMFCEKCGKENKASSNFCSNCGRQNLKSENTNTTGGGATIDTGTRDNSSSDFIYPRNPPLSPHLCWLAFLFIGIPQLVFGQVAKAIQLFVGGIVLTLIFPPIWFVGIFASAIDGYMVGKKLNQGGKVGTREWFPQS